MGQFCDDDEKPHPTQVAYVDGYPFGDTLLEGVRFKVEIVDGQLLCNGVHPEDEAYMTKFSAAQRAAWNTEAVEQLTICDADATADDGTNVHWVA